MTKIEEKQFLSDVITAAGLVCHGKQCKALGERIAKYAYKRMFEMTEMIVELKPSSIWVLTEEYNDYNDYNDYDQYDQYFVYAWEHKPTKLELRQHGVDVTRWNMKDYLQHVLDGGGRLEKGTYYDNQWYILKEIKNDLP